VSHELMLEFAHERAECVAHERVSVPPHPAYIVDQSLEIVCHNPLDLDAMALVFNVLPALPKRQAVERAWQVRLMRVCELGLEGHIAHIMAQAGASRRPSEIPSTSPTPASQPRRAAIRAGAAARNCAL
jgi:hypothetical protein